MKTTPNPVPRAMILAAGRGERMRPLTDHTPKPLLAVQGKPLIVWHIEALARAGVDRIVINTAWLEEQFPAMLGDGSRFGVELSYSMEGRGHGGALETAGGIATARPWEPDGDAFWLLSADIWCPGFRYDPDAARRFVGGHDRAHLWLVPNPSFHPAGDFSLTPDGRVSTGSPPGSQRLTYANFALCRAALVAPVEPGRHAKLQPLLVDAAHADELGGSLWEGTWENVGTPAQLAQLA